MIASARDEPQLRLGDLEHPPPPARPPLNERGRPCWTAGLRPPTSDLNGQFLIRFRAVPGLELGFDIDLVGSPSALRVRAATPPPTHGSPARSRPRCPASICCPAASQTAASSTPNSSSPIGSRRVGRSAPACAILPAATRQRGRSTTARTATAP